MNVRLSRYHRYASLAYQYYRKIFAMIILLVLIRAVRSYFMYVVVDKYLQEEYRESYTNWKLMQSSSYEHIPNEIQEDELMQADRYEDMQKYWSEFGPLSGIILISMTISCCGTVLCCLR